MRLPTSLHRPVAAAAALTLALATAVAIAPAAAAAPANGTPLLNETFTGTSVANPNIIGLNDACLTAATSAPPAGSSNLGVCAHRDGTPANDASGGWLQLTDKSFNRTGGMVYNQALPANAGIQAEFSTWQFGGGAGSGAADGISFFLVDGAVDLDGVGAYGGSLGYAQKNDALGVNGGYVGVGLDSYGNFANDSENRGSGCPAGQHSPVTPSSALVKNAVVIRGPMLGDRDNGYCYLTGTVNLANNTTTLPGSLRDQNLSGAARKIRLTVSPDEFPTVTVEIDFTGTGNGYQTVITYRMTTAAPLTWKFGFAGSTGGGNDVHLIRTPEIQTVDPLPPGINLVKQVDRTQQQPDSYTAGDTVPYQFVVTNTALAPLTNVTVTDPKVTNISCPATSLGAAGSATASMTCTGSHLLTAGETASSTEFTNTATATGISSGQSVSSESSVTVPLTEKPAIAINKTARLNDANGNGGADVGETINYSFLVTNAGNVPLTGVGVTDSKVGAVSCPASTLAPLATTTCTGSYPVKQADVDAGIVHNSATAHGKPPTTAQIVSQPSTADVPVVAAAPAITIVKTATLHDQAGGEPGLGDLGEHISYSFKVTNAGNVTLTGVTVSDPTVGAVTCSPTTLAPGGSANCTGPDHVITAADIAKGRVDNTARASGQPPSGNRITSQPSSATVPTVAPNAQLTIVKTATLNEADDDGQAVVGDTIGYTFLVSNVGNVAISGVGVTDAKAGGVICTATSLQPGQSTQCQATAVYTVVQADVDNGSIDNTATARGTAVTGPVASLPDTATVPVEKAVPQITIEKTATLHEQGTANGLAAVGDTITYSFVVTNTGNVTLHGVGVTDSKVGPVSCPVTTLAPGAGTTCRATYTVTQADIDASTGEIVNTATSHGLAPGATDPTVSDPDDAVVPAAGPHPQITVTKHAALATDANGNHLANVGDTIAYTFTVTNVGNVTLHDVSVTDPRAGDTTCDVTTLAPTASTTCAADNPYTVVQADVDAGAVLNTATAHGTPPVGAAVTASDTARVPTPAPNPHLLIVKHAELSTDANGNDLADVGDEITYTFTVYNIGNVTVTAVEVTDALAGSVTCDVTTLAPLAQATCAADATYTVTQADVNAGVITNTATATGTYAGGDVPSNQATAEVFTPQAAPAIRLTKVATLDDPNGNDVGDVGETISYTFTVHNTGNVTLDTVGVTDPLTGGAITCTATTLDPAESTSCTAAATYTITQADVDSGGVDNTATATGTTPAGAQVTDDATATVPTTPQQPGLALVKSHSFVTDAGDDGVGDVGDTIQYSFVVTNTGTVTLHDIAVTDTLAGDVTCDDDTLAPNASTTCAADDLYTVTQADVDAGAIDNTATPTATTPQDEPFTGEPDTDTVTTTEPAPSLALSKEGDLDDTNGNHVADVGETVDYTFTVTNNGNVTLTGIAIDDDTAGPVTCDDTTLAPGASTTCHSVTPYPVTQADVDARGIRNVATASGLDPAQETVTSPEARDAVPTARQVPAIVLGKIGIVNDVDGPGNVDGAADAGETVSYVFLVFNTGNVSLVVSVADPKLGAVTCAATSLAPQEFTTCTAPDHTVTQADVDNGEITNTATAVGIPPRGTGPVSDESTEVVPTAGPHAAIVLQKTAVLDDSTGRRPGLAEVGEPISYQFTVTNTGNLTLHDVTVDDPTVGAVTCDLTTLAPGEHAACVAADSHSVTQADVDAGHVTNTATATAIGPGEAGEQVESNPASAVVPTVPEEPGIGLSKEAHLTDLVVANGLANAGDHVSWTFHVVNTGNVTLTDVAVSDSRAGSVTCDATTLAPGEATDCRSDASHLVTLLDVENGPIVNVATVIGAPPTGPSVTSPQARAQVPTPPAVPRLFLVKRATLHDGNGNGVADLGETITYTFTVVNVGTATATDVHVTDSMFGGPIACTPSTLKPAPSLAEIGNGQTASCGSHAHTVTDADLNAPEQFIHNRATATGTDLTGGAVHSLPSVADVPVARPTPTVGELVLTKTASSATVTAGDTLSYTLTVTNTGESLLAGTVTDDLSDVLDDATLSGSPQASAGAVSVSGTTLTWTGSVPGAAVVTITYSVTVNASGGNGVLDNSASVGGGSCADGAASCSTSTPVEKELPATGAPIQDWTLLGAGLLLAGVAFVLGGRRRRVLA